MLYIDDKIGYFILGGSAMHNNLQYVDKNIISKASLPSKKSFFAAVYVPQKKRIHTFGGYDTFDKV